MNLYIGLMSGTSMDGIDAAVVDVAANQFICGLTRPYSKELKQHLQALNLPEQHYSLSYYNKLNRLIGVEFAEAALEVLAASGYTAQQITAIGSHGQTICHDVTANPPYTVQLGCGHTIAEMTKIKVVTDFRNRDLVTGGQGAPLAPVYHQALFTGQPLPLAIVNIGGIANLTYLSASEPARGYDLGTGNCLLDAWIYQHLAVNYDKNGEWAASGQVIDGLLSKLLTDEYFQRPLPKSIGKEYFSLTWLNNFLTENDKPADVQATLAQFTAVTIAEGIKREPIYPQAVYICGGGVHNPTIMQALKKLLPGIAVQSTENLHINPDFIEAQIFAWLAEKTVSNKPIDLSSITGAKCSAVHGVIYPAGLTT